MKQIDLLNNKLLSLLDDKYSVDIFSGKIGLCIYFYYLSRWENNKKYESIADKLLDEATDTLPNYLDITVENGLAGIAIGISHLVKANFVAGDINVILEEVDNRIFKILAFLKYEESKIPKQTLILLLFYFYLRYTEQSSTDDKYIFQELIIKTVELFQHNLPSFYFHDHFSFSAKNYQTPLFLFVISKIYDLNIFFDRIKNSEAWNAMLNREYYLYKHRGLFNGYPGAYLTMLHIKNHFL